MSNTLTPKQEKFAQRYIELGNASEAYRQAYDAENMSPEAIKVEACRLLQNPNVALTVINLQEDHRERHKVTVDSITHELDELKEEARTEKQYSPAITAVMGKAKIHGLLTDKSEITGPDGGPIKTETTVSITPDLVKTIVQQVRDEF